MTRFSALFLSALLTTAPVKAAELVMFESEICPWCELWDRELSAVYPKTPEGKRAPLRRVDHMTKRPEDLQFIENIRYTPVFVLIENGKEYGRIDGYPSEDFFWGLLGEMLDELPEAVN